MNWSEYQNGMYQYYCKHTENPVSKSEFLDEVKDYKNRSDKYVVYYGYSKKDTSLSKPIYVGTTIQHPMSRWYYHSTHGKDLVFVEMFRYDNETDMLSKEYEMICQLHPQLNKIVKRPQNFNVELTPDVIESRKDNPEWCQMCLRRRVRPGYKICYFCQTGR